MSTDERIEDWEILDVLAGLLDKSLISTVADLEHGRWRMLETVRQYAAIRLMHSGEAEAIRRRHAECYLALAETIEPLMEGHGQKEHLEHLESEYGNLRAALQFWLHAEDGATPAASLGAALYWFWYIRGYWTEGREHLSAVIARRADCRDATRLGKAIYAAGILAYSQGDFVAAEAHYLDSRDVRRGAGDRKGEAAVVSAMGLLAKERSDLATARRLYEESLTLRREIDDQGGIAGSLNNLGVLLADLGEHTEALALFEECLEIQRRLGNQYAIATAVGNIGRSALYMGDVRRAREMFEESLELRREIGDARGTLLALFSLGFLFQKEGRHEEAVTRFQECLTLGEAVGDVWAVAHANLGLGNEALESGDYTQALDLYVRCLRTRRDIGDQTGTGETLIRIAQALVRAGQFAEAARLFAAGDGLLTATGVAYPKPFLQEWTDDAARLKTAMGEAAFQKEHARGRKLTLEAAVALALEASSASRTRQMGSEL